MANSSVVTTVRGSNYIPGSGNPEGVVTAAVGAKFVDQTNGVEYLKETGAGNTGWRKTSDCIPFVEFNNARFTPRVTTNELTNGTNLIAAIAAANAASPNGSAKSSKNRVTVFLEPGRYKITGEALVLSAEFVDLIGASRDGVYIWADDGSVLRQIANDVRIETLTLDCLATTTAAAYGSNDKAAYFPASNLPATVIRNVTFMGNGKVGITSFGSWAMRLAITYSGKYYDCLCQRSDLVDGLIGFGWGGVASGYFENCTDLSEGFGGRFTASGTFINCRSGSVSFGGGFGGNVASGTFFNCQAGNISFGSFGTFSGLIQNCRSANCFFIGTVAGTIQGFYDAGYWQTTYAATFIGSDIIIADGFMINSFDGARLFNLKVLNKAFAVEANNRSDSVFNGYYENCYFRGDTSNCVIGNARFNNCTFVQNFKDGPVIAASNYSTNKARFVGCRFINEFNSSSVIKEVWPNYAGKVVTFNGDASGMFTLPNSGELKGATAYGTLYWTITDVSTPAPGKRNVTLSVYADAGHTILVCRTVHAGYDTAIYPAIGGITAVQANNSGIQFRINGFDWLNAVNDSDVGNTIVVAQTGTLAACHSSMRNGYDANVTNAIATPYDVIDTDL